MLTQGPFQFLCYMEDIFMPLIDLVNLSGNGEATLSLWIVSVATYDCGYTFTTKNDMVSLDCNIASVSSASRSHIQETACSPNTVPGALTLKCCSQMDLLDS